jgi:hypothetical protein
MNRRKPLSGKPKSSKELSEQLTKGEFRPSKYMRARRPELFSDSTVESQSLLGHELFEYHLETLTSRKEETKFEHFARRLCEREICPNLLPQTGPTGGGDSKTDSENYPVAKSIAMRWYEGDPAASAEQRWAFAFSAMKKWRPKVISDVAKIAGTERGYSKVFFVTNQFVKDKDRAALEAELKLKHGFEVRIFDRTWIVNCVFEHDRIELAIETLGLDVELRPRKMTGPRDLSNERRLEQLEKEIDDPLRYAGAQYHLVEDCLQAALLARNLELPRIDVEGRFERAQRIAQEVNYPQQLLRVSYNRAWTCFWWYDDLKEFLRHYALVEEFALKSSSAEDLQWLVNLWQLLNSSCRSGRLDPSQCQLEQHTQALIDSLEALGQERNRVNNSHHARTELIFIKLARQAPDSEAVGPLLLELRDAIREARGLISYPFEPLPRIVEELGNVFTDLPEYDELLEEATSTARERLSQQEAGRMLLARGIQKLRANRPYEAIVYFGRAQQSLAMRESRWEISESLFMCGSAYEAGGLFWAARANVLGSLNQVLSEYWDHGFIAPRAATCAQKLAWIEIELGRVACAISWMELADLLARGAKLADKALKTFTEGRWNQDAVLGILFLRAKQEDLRYLQYLPDVLEELGLDLSRIALLYALGYEDQMRSERLMPEGETSEQAREFFIKWFNQPAAADLPERLVGTVGKMTFLSSVLGCRLKFVVEDDNQSIFLSERLLGAIEALLATSLSEEVFPYREDYVVRVERSNRVKGTPELEIDQEGGFSILRHNGNILTTGDTEENWVLETIALLISQIVTTPDEPDGYLHRIFGEQLGLSRALNFTETSVPVSNIFGASSKLRLPDWNTYENPGAYICKRAVPWHEGLIPQKAPETYKNRDMDPGAPPKELYDRSSLKHSGRQVSSVINQALWNKAKWKAVAYVWSIDPDEPPYIALAFQNGDAGKAIFRELIEKLGSDDKQNRLRISIITGLNKAFPNKYGVVIGSNLPDDSEFERGREIVSISRVHHMDNTNPMNLRMFQERFERAGKFWLMAAYWPKEQAQPILYDTTIISKNSIRIAPAWQLGDNDLDSTAIGAEDDPIIPTTVLNAPVLRLLERRKLGYKFPSRNR